MSLEEWMASDVFSWITFLTWGQPIFIGSLPWQWIFLYFKNLLSVLQKRVISAEQFDYVYMCVLCPEFPLVDGWLYKSNQILKNLLLLHNLFLWIDKPSSFLISWDIHFVSHMFHQSALWFFSIGTHLVRIDNEVIERVRSFCLLGSTSGGLQLV